jgi:Polyketide cyclase / dehydrase and lipid transport
VSDVAVSRSVAAAPAVVWRLIGDPTRMGEWSPEAVRQVWLDGGTEPALGARFRGTNRIGLRRWSTVCTLVAWAPERQIAWDVATFGLATARWSYRLLPDGAGTLLVEEFTDHRGPAMKVIGPLGRGVVDVVTHNRGTMIATLAAIAAAAEAAAVGGVGAATEAQAGAAPEAQAGADTARQGPTTAPS